MKLLRISIIICMTIVNVASPVFAQKKDSFKTFLPKNSSQISGYTWNNKKVSRESCAVIFELLNKYSSTFKQQERDVRYLSEGPMMQLAPSAFFGFKHKGNGASVELYSLSKENRVVQVAFGIEKKQYFSSRAGAFISAIEKIKELK